MAATGDVTFTQDGAHGNVKLHPYLVALVRWCVECLWKNATVVLHRLLTPLPLPPAVSKPKPVKRPASSDHLDPEPRVECQILHQPATHGLDVVFVHGLYGSLANTWRQGEWTSKYNRPETVHLSRPTSLLRPCDCTECANSCGESAKNSRNYSNVEKNIENKLDGRENVDEIANIIEEADKIDIDKGNKCNYIDKIETYDTVNLNDGSFSNIDEVFYKNIEEEIFITERFYDNALLDQLEIVDNYEKQAKFVSDLFKKSCDTNCDDGPVIFNDNSANIDNKYDNNILSNDENMSLNDKGIYQCNGDLGLEKSNHIMITNHNSDKEKSLNDNMSDLKSNKTAHTSGIVCECRNKENQCEAGCGCNCDDCYSSCWPRDWIKVDFPEARVISINYTSDPHLWRPLWIKENKRLRLHERAEQMMQQLLQLGVGRRPIVWVGHSKGGLFIKQIYCEAYEAYLKTVSQNPEDQNMTQIDEDNKRNNFKDNNKNNDNDINNDIQNNDNEQNQSSKSTGNDMNILTEDTNTLDIRIQDNKSRTSQNSESLSHVASLWSNSVGFMFYSVPHRGAPLADIKTPITARSVELLEISKDCSLVLSLQERWLRAASASAHQPLVRSLVETRRTLMSVLWLRIVSAQSADPGIGPLCGVSVDHREICKPSSRRCLLYTELAALIRNAIAPSRNPKTEPPRRPL